MKAAGNAVGDAEESAAATSKTVRGAGDISERVAEVFQSHPSSRLIILLCALLLILMGSLQSCTPLAQSVLESLIIGTYPATDDDVRAAERAYAAKERELQDEMDRYEQYHPGYDEYHVNVDEIWHDPYVLIAIISAYFDGQEWTLDTAYVYPPSLLLRSATILVHVCIVWTRNDPPLVVLISSILQQEGVLFHCLFSFKQSTAGETLSSVFEQPQTA